VFFITVLCAYLLVLNLSTWCYLNCTIVDRNTGSYVLYAGTIYWPKRPFCWWYSDSRNPVVYYWMDASQIWLQMGAQGEWDHTRWCSQYSVFVSFSVCLFEKKPNILLFMHLTSPFMKKEWLICGVVCWQDLKSTLAQELDFENEGRNGERCARELHSLSYISVPLIFWHNTSKVAAVSWLYNLCMSRCLDAIGRVRGASQTHADD